MAKRKREVYPTDEIAHLWAHQTAEYARNPQGNHRFNNGVIYSYAEPIGRIVNTGRGTRNLSGPSTVALYRNAHWSVTTSRHQRFMREATGHMAHFTVADIGQRYGVADSVNHKANLKDYRERIIQAAQSAKRARSHAEWRLQDLTRLVDEANNYSAAFRLATRFNVPSDTDLAALAERAKAQAAERQRQRIAEVTTVHLPAWLAGEQTTGYYALRQLPTAYLRITGTEVETSLGARVPLAHVQRALPIVLRLIERGEAYQRNGHTIHLGHYALDSISADGIVRAGCHTFERAEIERFAKIVEALPAAPEPEPALA